jgi:hypothetical protein
MTTKVFKGRTKLRGQIFNPEAIQVGDGSVLDQDDFEGFFTGETAFTTSDGERSISANDRFSDEVNLREFTGYDPSGVASTNHTALESAWAAMIDRGRSRVIVPPGTYRLGDEVDLEKTFVDGTRCELVGAGSHVTQFIGPTSSANIFNIGSLSGSQTGNIGFREFSIAPGSTHTGYAMAFENCRNVDLANIDLHLPKKGFGLGMTSVSTDDQVEEIFFTNVGGRLQSGAGSAFFDLGCCQQLHVWGGRTTGRVDQYYINQASSVSNSDGVYVRGIFSELWGYAIRSVGLGIVNCVIDVKQFDRAVTFIYVSGGAGSNRHWMVKGQFLGEATGATSTDPAFLFNSDSGGLSIECIVIHDSVISGRTGPVAVFTGSSSQATRRPVVLFTDNIVQTCGKGGVDLFQVDAYSNPSFYGNLIYKGVLDAALGNYRYAFAYQGSSTGRRNDPTNVNTILDAGTGAVSGTP